MAIFIDEELAPNPRSAKLGTDITFTISLSDDVGPKQHELTFKLSDDNELSWEAVGGAASLIKEVSEKVTVRTASRELSFVKKVFGPKNPGIANFLVRLLVPGTAGSSCRVIIE
jgi:hypothetical protein